MDCYRKIIQFNPLNCPSFEFLGNGANPSMLLISALEAHRLLDNGCQGYLAFVGDQSREEMKLEEIPVVQEFPDIFPEELLGLPP